MKIKIAIKLSLLGALILGIILFLPTFYVSFLEIDGGKFEKPIDSINFQTQIRNSLISLFGAIALIVGAYFTLRRVRAVESEVEISRKTLENDRFSKAVEHLASRRSDIRVGGIFLLKSVALVNSDLVEPAIEILNSFVMENRSLEKIKEYSYAVAMGKQPMPNDIRLAMAVLGTLIGTAKGTTYSRFMLESCVLTDLSLKEANFRNYSLSHSKFINCRFDKTSFEKTWWEKTELVGGNSFDCDFSEAFITESRISSMLMRPVFFGTTFYRCDLTRFSPIGGDFTDAKFVECQGLSLDTLLNTACLYSASIPAEYESKLREQKPELFENKFNRKPRI